MHGITRVGYLLCGASATCRMENGRNPNCWLCCITGKDFALSRGPPSATRYRHLCLDNCRGHNLCAHTYLHRHPPNTRAVSTIFRLIEAHRNEIRPQPTPLAARIATRSAAPPRNSDSLGRTAPELVALPSSGAPLPSRHLLVGLLRQSVFGRLAGYEDVNDAERLCRDPAMR